MNMGMVGLLFMIAVVCVLMIFAGFFPTLIIVLIAVGFFALVTFLLKRFLNRP